MKFHKKIAQTQQTIPTASLPDIIFMLLIFFMVTTVMRTVTLKVQTRLPQHPLSPRRHPRRAW